MYAGEVISSLRLFLLLYDLSTVVIQMTSSDLQDHAPSADLSNVIFSYSCAVVTYIRYSALYKCTYYY